MIEENIFTKIISLAEPILPLFDSEFPKGTDIGKVYRKVKGLLEDYAEHIRFTPRKLRILDVYTERGELASKLNRYITALPRSEKQSVQRLRNYQSEIRSNLRRISKTIFKLARDSQTHETLNISLLELVPNEMCQVLEYLPREGVKGPHVKLQKRMQLPITERGLLLLSAMVNVWRRLNLSSLQELFKNIPAIRQEIFNIGPSPLAMTTVSYLYPLRDKLGVERSAIKESCCLEVNQWPQPLRHEWQTFEKLAIEGVEAGHKLIMSAKRLKFSIKKLSPATISNYRKAFGYALNVIGSSGNLSISDLIRVVPRESAPDDEGIPKQHNTMVDLYRLSEQQKRGRVKGRGYDSGIFTQFVQGVMSVAARNGYGHQIKAFHDAYVLFLDHDAKDSCKAKKKAGISVMWIDQEIIRLCSKYLQIVNSGSFKVVPGRIMQAHKDIQLVLFFVWLTTLRYMGYRQQSIRHCIIGNNFILKPNGTIILHFDETKNRKRIHLELSESEPGTHGLLWKVLYSYYKNVYPYLVKESSNTLRGEFFVTTSKNNFFRPFKNFSDFDSAFFRGRNKFLRISELENDLRYKLNPHFLRGLCADWMIIGLGMSINEAAEVLGDDPKTLEKHYVDKNRVYDAGAVFKAVSRRRRIALEEPGADARIENTLERIEKNFQDALVKKDAEIELLRRQLKEREVGG